MSLLSELQGQVVHEVRRDRDYVQLILGTASLTIYSQCCCFRNSGYVSIDSLQKSKLSSVEESQDTVILLFSNGVSCSIKTNVFKPGQAEIMVLHRDNAPPVVWN
jgi:hypothetical protein